MSKDERLEEYNRLLMKIDIETPLGLALGWVLDDGLENDGALKVVREAIDELEKLKKGYQHERNI